MKFYRYFIEANQLRQNQMKLQLVLIHLFGIRKVMTYFPAVIYESTKQSRTKGEW